MNGDDDTTTAAMAMARDAIGLRIVHVRRIATGREAAPAMTQARHI